MFNAAFFRNNRKRLRQLYSGKAPIILAANGLVQMRGDVTYTFAQEANFWYLSGINEPDILLVMDEDEDYLIIPARSASRQAFDGVLEPKTLSSTSGIKVIYSEEEGWEKLAKRLTKVMHYAGLTPPPPYVDTFGFYTNPSRQTLANKLNELKSELELIDISSQLVDLRMVKQPAELEAIQRAIDVTIETLKEATTPTKLKSYQYEYQLEAAITAGFRRHGAQGHGFSPIVAGGQNAVTIHQVANNSPLNKTDLVIVDVGAEVANYSADLTRTYALGKPTARQRDVYQAVLAVQTEALDLLKPGVVVKDYEVKVEQIMGQQLKKLGLIKTLDHDSIRRYYPHATSHMLGLNVHDIADYSRPLEKNMVLTVEPGIYIKEESLAVRIEDDIVITKDGNRILSSELERKL